MTAGQIQGITQQGITAEVREDRIPTPLKILVVAVSAVAGAALGFLIAGLAGLAIGALAGAALSFSAIAIINCLRQGAGEISSKPGEISPSQLTDLTDPKAAQGLTDFYRYLPEEITANGPTSGQAQEIQDWMKQSEAIRNCEKLDLSGIGLTQLPREIGLFTGLMNLKLAGNQLQIIPIEIGNLRSLRHLDLSNNQLQVLPVEIGNLEALQTLGLPGNQLQALPAEIGNLRSLVHLYFTDSQVYNRHFRDRSQSSLVAFLSNNQPQTARDVSFSILHQSHNVPGIPAKLVEINATGLTDLTDPELAKSLVDFYRYLPNEITANGPTSGQAQEIQDWMKQSEAVRNCKKLDLSGIGLTQLPKEIGLFVNLKELNLAFNRLKGVPAEIGGLASLEGLNLFSNQLQAIPVEIGNLGSLKYLDLSYNKLQSLPIIREIAEKLGTLDHLQLGFNEFEGLPDEFGHLRRTVIQGYYERKHVWL